METLMSKYSAEWVLDVHTSALLVSMYFVVCTQMVLKRNEINIALSEQVETDVNVYDIAGRQVFYNHYSEKDIQFSLNVASGSYFVNIAFDNRSITKTIVIE